MKFALATDFFVQNENRTNEPLGSRHMQMIADADIDCIELMMAPPNPAGPQRDANVNYTNPVQIARVANSARKHGIEICSIHAPYGLVNPYRDYVNVLLRDGFDRGTAMQMADASGIDIWDLTRPNNYAGREALKGLIDITAMLGGQLIAAHIDRIYEQTGPQKEALYDNLMAVVPYMEEHGVSLGIENIYAEGMQFIKRIPSKYVGAVLCTHHTANFPDYPDFGIYPPTEPLVRVIHEYGDKLIHLHLNEIIKITEDNLKISQEWYEHAPKTLDELADVYNIMAHLIPYEPGGGIEWPPILKALKEINFDRVALFEPSGILPDKQAEGLKRIKAGIERMAQEFAAV